MDFKELLNNSIKKLFLILLKVENKNYLSHSYFTPSKNLSISLLSLVIISAEPFDSSLKSKGFPYFVVSPFGRLTVTKYVSTLPCEVFSVLVVRATALTFPLIEPYSRYGKLSSLIITSCPI